MKKKSVFKKVIIGIVALLTLLILVVGGYLAYVFATYSRIDDNKEVAAKNQLETEGEVAKLGESYTIISYNIGFGAYSADYSFFMDGGKYSRAFSKNAVINNTDNAMALVKQYKPDFVCLQEVDTDSTRSYHVNLEDRIRAEFSSYSSTYGVNYHSAYLFYPILEPHGKSNSGLMTLSDKRINEAIRRRLPISEDFSKMLDLDRCYVKNYIPTEDGHYLVIINVHLSAYTSDVSIVQNQIKMLASDIQDEYEMGNYIICAGDFNQDLLGNSPEVFGTEDSTENWAKPFPKEYLPENFKLACDLLTEEEIANITPSCRNADKPYSEGNFVTMVDGFIVSDNINFEMFSTIDSQFANSDHNPVIMKFSLKGSNAEEE